MLFAEEVRQQQEVVQSVNFWLTIGLLIGLLLGAAAILSLTELWRKKQAKPAKGGIESLSMYRAMYEDGELDEEEYRVIRDRLARELTGKPAGPATAKGVGAAGGANPEGSPGPPPESPEQAPPVS